MGNNRNMDIETAAPGKDPYFVLSGLQDLSLFLSCDRAWPPASHASYVSLYEIFQHLFPFPSSTYSVFLVPSLLDHSLLQSLLGALPSCSTETEEAQSGDLHPLPLVLVVACQTLAAKMVKQIENKYAFEEALNSAGDKLVVVDFSATWCGPCKMIQPFFHSLSEKYSNVVFLEVDVDDCQDVASV